MSWSVSAAAKRDEAIALVRAQLATVKGNYLNQHQHPGEVERADKILDTVENFAKADVGENDVLKISAWGSESSVWVPDRDEWRIVGIQGGYNVSVEPQGATAANPLAAA